MHRARRSSHVLPRIIVLIGAGIVIFGFFLPWVEAKPSAEIMEGASTSLVKLSAWDLATGVTVSDLLHWQVEKEVMPDFIRRVLSYRVVPPLVWLFIFPFIALIGILIDFIAEDYFAFKALLILGIFVLLSDVLHIVLIEKGIHTVVIYSLQHAESVGRVIMLYLVALLVDFKASIGVYVSIGGSIIWLLGAVAGLK